MGFIWGLCPVLFTAALLAVVACGGGSPPATTTLVPFEPATPEPTSDVPATPIPSPTPVISSQEAVNNRPQQNTGSAPEESKEPVEDKVEAPSPTPVDLIVEYHAVLGVIGPYSPAEVILSRVPPKDVTGYIPTDMDSIVEIAQDLVFYNHPVLGVYGDTDTKSAIALYLIAEGVGESNVVGSDGNAA